MACLLQLATGLSEDVHVSVNSPKAAQNAATTEWIFSYNRAHPAGEKNWEIKNVFTGLY